MARRRATAALRLTAAGLGARQASASTHAAGAAAAASAPRVLRLVLTGGPCGGKTTALPTIAAALRERGLPTVIVGETATGLVESGIDRIAMIGTPEGLFDFNLQ